MRVALATCSVLPEGDPDDELLVAALGGAEFAVWDDPRVDWGAYDLVVPRSTWDYYRDREAFLAWARSVPRVLNPPQVLEWNTDKRYLAELPGAVPTAFVAPGEPFAAPDGDYVVKPSVGAGSKDAARFGPGDEARAAALVETIHAGGGTAMVQSYLHAIDEVGETALQFFDGQFSHAIRKGPLLRPGAEPAPGLYAYEDIAERKPSLAELAAARAALGVVRARFGELAYARVDLAPGPAGPLVLELELTEPSLFFALGTGAAERMAAALASRS